MSFRMKSGSVALMLAIMLGLSACSEEAAPVATKGEKMPNFPMMSLSGEVVDSDKLFAGKVVVLNAWATWCPPCRKEMPDLVALSNLLPADKFLVVGLSVDNNLEDVKRFVDEEHVTFPMYWDEGGSKIANRILKSFRFPETYILNAEGVIVEKVAGAFPWASPEIISILKVIQRTGKVPAVEEPAAAL
ncbi:TlpA disulfide reductase family protein [Mariprofundus sp. KV]|uniref:TlpA family protein disulfide reductase n=1 Tax=Mariprofundus sp. KV TaxID=2608715 RepID=UPI0015A2572E|nr:TlpA disulfide reductase family protein [Mariprofundus sp. KV]NWF35425.1 TlpA family protein disulfide reductase [Mariprofundus sp. KV]